MSPRSRIDTRELFCPGDVPGHPQGRPRPRRRVSASARGSSPTRRGTDARRRPSTRVRPARARASGREARRQHDLPLSLRAPSFCPRDGRWFPRDPRDGRVSQEHPRPPQSPRWPRSARACAARRAPPPVARDGAPVAPPPPPRRPRRFFPIRRAPLPARAPASSSRAPLCTPARHQEATRRPRVPPQGSHPPSGRSHLCPVCLPFSRLSCPCRISAPRRSRPSPAST